jgi:ornithine cyclodeaminase/alanine dehydrogenase-like protein (mu-crystallin family)
LAKSLRDSLCSAREGKERFVVGGLPVFGSHEVVQLPSIDEALKAVERGLVLEVQGATVMPPKLYLNLPQQEGDFRAMPVCDVQSAYAIRRGIT